MERAKRSDTFAENEQTDVRRETGVEGTRQKAATINLWSLDQLLITAG